MSDASRNPPDNNLWPQQHEIIKGWVLALDAVTIGFSVSPSWAPPPDILRRVRPKNRSILSKMHLPPDLAGWAGNALRRGEITSLSIQVTRDRSLVAITLPSQRESSVADTSIIEATNAGLVVDSLVRVAKLPRGSDGQKVAELGEILRSNPNYSEEDALFHWLSDRIRRAVQKIFDEAPPGFMG